MSTWSWIGIAAGSWCVFSFGIALLLGRAIRMSDRRLRPPALPHADRHSGLCFSRDHSATDSQTGTDG